MKAGMREEHDGEAVDEADQHGAQHGDEDGGPEAEIRQDAGKVHHDLPLGTAGAHHHRGENGDGDDGADQCPRPA